MTYIRLMMTRRLVLGYFLLMAMLMVWVMFSFGRWCPPNSPTPQMFPHAMSNVDHEIRSKERRLNEKEEQLKQREILLKQHESAMMLKFPEKASLIHNSLSTAVPTIYAITPTYARPVQKAELTRLSQTFLHVKNFHWIVVEDSFNKTELLSKFLAKTGLKYTHLNIGTPPAYKMADDDPNWLKPRGVLQRNLGLEWIRKNVNIRVDKGVIYFADDDNTYDLQLFEEMRLTDVVSVWPVGLVGNLRFERPLCENNRVVGWYTYWRPERPFPMDMAGFAINVKRLFERPGARFALRVRRGYQESELLRQLVTVDELEPRADMCTQILVWHTRTEKANLKNEDKLKAKGLPGSDASIEV